MKITQGEMTRFVESHLQDYDCENNPEELIDYIKELNDVRLFADAVYASSKKCGYSGNREELDKLNHFVRELILKNTGIKENPVNIKHWLADTKPQREKVYILCFAFHMNANEAFDFFVKAYLERPFNYRNLRETVYAFCFNNGLNYFDADRIVKQLEGIKNSNSVNEQTNTQQIGLDVLGLDNERQLVDYCFNNLGCFSVNSSSARNEIMDLMDSYGRKVADIDKNVSDNIGRVMPEIASDRRILQTIFGGNIRMQEYNVNNKPVGYRKNPALDKLPSKLRVNLPQEEQLKQIRDGKASDDTIRKSLIMLKFFDFFASEELLEDSEDCENNGYYKEFLGEMNMTLIQCGYGEMYIRNPYDWLFAYCASQSDPIGTFNDIMDHYGFAHQKYIEEFDENGEPKYKEVFR